MEELIYTGEHLLPGKIGHFLLLLGFVSILFSAFSYFKSTKSEDKQWISLGRFGFLLHGIGIFGVIAMLFYVMGNQMYEYYYAFEHVSDDLPMRYIVSAFWEGQEGSFLLWSVWHVILGAIVIYNGGKWESRVIFTLLLIQAFILSMILGLHIGFGEYIYKIGSNPTLLLRDTMQAPIFNNAEYLSLITGTGLNPLLQNYWMTIHPPVLFLGFASTSLPFAYAVAALWSKSYHDVLGPMLKWGLFSGAFLGIGILMGGAWAYEALSFGGYWAWDPVENMSLVPWLILIAGIHTNVIAKSTGFSIRSTLIFYLLTFVLIVYSTFLTRSGILGETSAHAFTEMGLEWQLVAFVLFFLLLGMILLAINNKTIPSKPKEESIYSREFWMFIGAIVLFFSGAIIATSSSLPVFNKIITYFNPEYVGRVITEPIPHYNKYQIWVSVFITILSGATLFFRYRADKWSASNRNRFLVAFGVCILLASLLTYLMSFWISYFEYRYAILSWSCVFGMLMAIWYFFTEGKANLKLAASAFSHFGFAIMVLGTVTSGLNTRIVSKNPFAMQGLVKDESMSKVVTLLKGVPLYVNDYWLTYERDSVEGRFRYFDVKFEKFKDSVLVESFSLQPNVQYDNKFKKVAASNPDTKHYWNRDIFTNIASLPRSQMDVELAKELEESLEYVSYTPSLGDTIFTSSKYGVIKNVVINPSKTDSFNLGVGLEIEFKSLDSEEVYTVMPSVALKENMIYEMPEVINPFNLKINVQDTFFESIFTNDADLDYVKYVVKENEPFIFKNFELKLNGFKKEVENPNYSEVENDIAVSADVSVRINNEDVSMDPVYIIRDNKPFSIKDYHANSGLHIRFQHIDPGTQSYTFMVAVDKRNFKAIPMEIAEEVPRSDLIIFEAKEFPGINLFWYGSISMMLGFLFALIRRYSQN